MKIVTLSILILRSYKYSKILLKFHNNQLDLMKVIRTYSLVIILLVCPLKKINDVLSNDLGINFHKKALSLLIAILTFLEWNDGWFCYCTMPVFFLFFFCINIRLRSCKLSVIITTTWMTKQKLCVYILYIKYKKKYGHLLRF